MSRVLRPLAIGVAAAALAVACVKVPYTGRTQFNLIPDSIMRGIGKNTYADMLDGKGIAKGGPNANTLNRVGGRISKAANKPTYDWRFSLIKESTINAWCLPGGYIGFYNGILPVLSNETGMAFVMGHEVGHATAHHGAERMSQRLAVLGGMSALTLYVDKKTKLNEEQKGILFGALGVGASVGILLPFSRAHEAEADVIGLMYMSQAGYPPAESIKVWDRMGAIAGTGKGPTFLSTHPSNAQRQKHLSEWMPQARKRYQRNKLPGAVLDTRWTVGGDEGVDDKPAPSGQRKKPPTKTKPSTRPVHP